jgi:hypothetical protein
MKKWFCIVLSLFFVCSLQSQQSVKFEVFHVDLVPATFLYGGAELAWSLAMYDALDKTIAAQTEIDTLLKKIVILEEKTQDYQKNLQSLFIQSLNPGYVDRIVSEIHQNQKWIDEHIAFYPEFAETAKKLKEKVTDRADKIKRYINDAAKKTGNAGRLDNKQRNDLNIYVLEELFKLKYISQNTKYALWTVIPPAKKIELPPLN